MSIRLRITLIVGIVLFALYIINLLMKKRLHLKYTLLWLVMILGMLFATFFPDLIAFISNTLGIITPVNFIFVLAGMFSLVIIVSITAIVSHMNNRIFRLVQNQALLEKRIRELESSLQKHIEADISDTE